MFWNAENRQLQVHLDGPCKSECRSDQNLVKQQILRGH
jgi:hypothetical protein